MPRLVEAVKYGRYIELEISEGKISKHSFSKRKYINDYERTSSVKFLIPASAAKHIIEALKKPVKR